VVSLALKAELDVLGNWLAYWQKIVIWCWASGTRVSLGQLS
jgi:hypothetical protein